MSADSIAGILKEWEGNTVTIINPESYALGKLTDKIAFESYEVKLATVTNDYIHIVFARPKKGVEEGVEQYIPLNRIKRVSVWGDQKFVQI